MGIGVQITLGLFAAIAASLIMIMRNPARIFGRALSLNEALCVCWVAYSIFMGVVRFTSVSSFRSACRWQRTRPPPRSQFAFQSRAFCTSAVSGLTGTTW